MNRNLHEDLYSNPDFYRRIAHRERARAVAEALAWLRRGLARLFGDLNARLTAPNLLRPARWIERLG